MPGNFKNSLAVVFSKILLQQGLSDFSFLIGFFSRERKIFFLAAVFKNKTGGLQTAFYLMLFCAVQRFQIDAGFDFIILIDKTDIPAPGMF